MAHRTEGPNRLQNFIPRWGYICLFAVMSGGCATIESADGSSMRMGSQAFREYSEQVFRLQNRIASDIAFALDDPARLDAAQIEGLEDADTALFEACALLNEVAIRRRDGGDGGIFSGIKAARSVPECESAAETGRGALRAAGLALD